MKPALDGFVLIDKPAGPNCREVLDALQRRLGVRGLGHAGTLDPLASGLLIVLLGRAVRLQQHFMQGRKRYEACIRFGQSSATDDGEGPFTDVGPVPADLLLAVQALLPRFLGPQMQEPPAVSALRVQGRRAWQSARAGKPLSLPARSITMYALEARAASAPDAVELSIECSSGTYVRSLARDLGRALGCGAFVQSLRRTQCGVLHVADALPAEAISAADVRPIGLALGDCVRVDVDVADALRLHQGAVLELRMPTGDGPRFAWHAGAPFCRLLEVEGGVRSGGTLLPLARCPASAQEFAHHFSKSGDGDDTLLQGE